MAKDLKRQVNIGKTQVACKHMKIFSIISHYKKASKATIRYSTNLSE